MFDARAFPGVPAEGEVRLRYPAGAGAFDDRFRALGASARAALEAFLRSR